MVRIDDNITKKSSIINFVITLIILINFIFFYIYINYLLIILHNTQPKQHEYNFIYINHNYL